MRECELSAKCAPLDLLDNLLADHGKPITREQIREDIALFEQCMRDAAGDQPELLDAPSDVTLNHRFAPGVYIREITMPAGMLIIGKIHRHAHANFISKGKVAVITEGAGYEILEAPMTMISEPGTKRVLVTYEETVWSTIHPTELTDLDEIEAEVIAPNYAALGLGDPDLSDYEEEELPCHSGSLEQ